MQQLSYGFALISCINILSFEKPQVLVGIICLLKLYVSRSIRKLEQIS